jgi:DNA mismatch repair protein MutL
MNYIRKLAPNEIKRIAAGEVVERPASIIKELIENSIDAESTSITISIEQGGKKYIKVEDNGKGMSHEDATLALELHTTSKLFEGLGSSTYGFRGEALASISSVSHCLLKTKDKNSELGTFIIKKNGITEESTKISFNNGTYIEISDIFESIPVRKKFLKTDSVEYNACKNVFLGLAFANPQIEFRFFHNQQLIYHFIATDNFIDRIKQYTEVYILPHIIPIKTEQNEYKLTGTMTDFSYATYDRSSIFLLINKRFIKQYKLTHTLLKAYRNGLPPNKYPIIILHLELPADQVDTNVHPRKEEVSLLNPLKIENFLLQSLIDALEKNHKEKITFSNVTNKLPPVSSDFMPQINENLHKFILPSEISKEIYAQLFLKEIKQEKSSKNELTEDINININLDTKIIPEKIKSIEPSISNISIDNSIQTTFIEPIRYIGTLLNTYILLEKKDQLIMIDQHALHEKIIYEDLIIKKIEYIFFPLLSPLYVKFDYSINLFEKEIINFKNHGFECSIFKSDTIIIHSYATFYKNLDIITLIKNLVELIKLNQKNNSLFDNLLHDIYAMISCKKAIKAGDKLSSEQIQLLLKHINEDHNLSLCPHGRPTTIMLSNYEIQKKFKRI